MRGKVSVIVPVYNSERFLSACIESVLMQNVESLEVIFVDDGSKDDSAKIIEQYKKRDKRIKLIKRENHGVSSARNIGINEATGEYIMFVDADDELMQDAIIRLMQIQQKNDVDIVYGLHCYGYQDKILKRISRINEGCYEYQALKGEIIDDGSMTGILFGSVAGSLYQRDFIIKNAIQFEEQVRINEDGLFNIDCLRYGARIYQYGEEPTYLYRQWKNEKKKSYQIMKNNFIVCDKALSKREFPFIDKEIIQKQKKLRKVTETFQLSLVVCESMNLIRARRQLKQIWNIKELDTCNRNDLKKINQYKLILYYLMKKKLYFWFYIVICYTYPVLKRLIRR